MDKSFLLDELHKLLEFQQEGEYWDFKQEWHNNIPPIHGGPAKYITKQLHYVCIFHPLLFNTIISTITPQTSSNNPVPS